MLQLNIDKSVNPWAYNLDLPNQQEYLNNLLDMGYRMSTLMKVNSKDPHTEELLELQQQKTKLVVLLKKFMGQHGSRVN